MTFKKLSLKTETLRALSDQQADRAVGGMMAEVTDLCYTQPQQFTCNGQASCGPCTNYKNCW